MFGENESLVKGYSIPLHNLSNIHLVICYHAIRDAMASGIWKFGSVKIKNNIANCMTNILSAIMK